MKRYTVGHEFLYIWFELRRYNENDGYAGKKEIKGLSFHSKKAQTQLFNLLSKQLKNINVDLELGIIDNEEYEKEIKICEDCERTIKHMEIY